MSQDKVLNIEFNLNTKKIIIIYDGQQYISSLDITSDTYWKKASYTLTHSQDKKWDFDWSCYNNREQYFKIYENIKNSSYLKENRNICNILGSWEYNYDPSKYTIQTVHVLGKNNTTNLKIFFKTIGVASVVNKDHVENIDFSNETYVDLSYGKSK